MDKVFLQDDKTAVKWYTLAAEQGMPCPIQSGCDVPTNGEGVPQDDKTAVKWYTLAAEQGHAKAQYNLGLMYANGEGVLQDIVYAHMWWNIAASNGHENAAANRDIAAGRMTSSQIEEAQRLARECVARNYKNC